MIVRCNNCFNLYNENSDDDSYNPNYNELELLAEYKDDNGETVVIKASETNSEKDYDYYKGCPVCMTDSYLMDIEEKV